MYMYWLCKLIFILSYFNYSDGILDKRQYQTNASLEKLNDMECYQCNTDINGDACRNVTLYENGNLFKGKCKGDKRTCMVKTYSYITGTRDSTTEFKIWFLERSCTNKCDGGCIVIGERTRLHSCISCCATPLCNIMNDSYKVTPFSFFIILFLSLINDISQ